MNKTVTVNIGGIVFHIDENAYERFKAYLESIRLHFTTAEGRDEIMSDIESRIAEMFQERVKDSKQVITLSDVEEVTSLMGRPEQFNDSETTREETVETPTGAPTQKRLYRNPDEKVVGGVCSGIAAYFDIDPVWIRLIFAGALIFFGSGFLLYLILWIIIPQAESSVEKLKMRGEPVNISNIGKNVQEGNKEKKSSVVSRFFDGVGTIFKYFFLFIGKLIALFFIFIGLVIGVALFFSMLALFKIPGTHIPEFFRHIFPDGFQFGLAFVSAILLIAIPFLMLAYAGARMLFNIKKSSRVVSFTALGIWLMALVVCLVLGVNVAREFSESSSIRQTLPITQPSTRSIRLEMENKEGERDDRKYYERWGQEDWDGEFFLKLKDGQLQSGDIHLDVVKSPTDSFQLEQILYSHGSSNKEASERATHISYSIGQMDSIMKFNKRFLINKDEKYRGQKVQLLLKVPVGVKVYFDPSMKGFIYDVDNVQNIYDKDMLGKNWMMTNSGLTCMDCDGTEDTVGDKGSVDINGSSSHVKIDENGVFISGGDNGDESQIKIDSNGVEIKANGKIKKIKPGKGVNIHVN